MTTDEKSDSKSNESQTSETTTTTTTTTTTQETIEMNTNQCVDNKIAVIESNLSTESISQSDEQNSGEMQLNNERLNGCHNSDENQMKPILDSEVNTNSSIDVEMKNAESVENLSKASTSMPDSSVCSSTELDSEEKLNFKIVYNKITHDMSVGLKESVLQLKNKIQTLTSVAPSMQKLCYRGLNFDDNKTVSEAGIKNGIKILVIGSTINDVIAVNLTTKEDIKEEKAQSNAKEPLCRQKQHKKILDKGIPSEAMPAWKNGTAPLPGEPLHGMLNKYGNKVRLTFKLEQDQLWVGTKERTEKLSMMSVRSIVSEPIEEHPEYHLMGIQTGPTEASRIWIYWVPAQFINAIKDTILGK